jgi:integrase/recombinase XerD
MLTKQAKILSEQQIQTALAAIKNTTHAIRDTVKILLSVRAGLRAKEIAALTWSMVLDGEGQMAVEMRLPNSASKGRRGGRVVPLHPTLREALGALRTERNPIPTDHVIYSARGNGVTAESTANWFWELYKRCGWEGCSSHSGRRTFITACARRISAAGGSLRDVQALAGHASLVTTERYICESAEAQRAVVGML